ncbi:MAG TPA: winged helix-turn-helix domain-containing protein [Rhodopila sp.]|jgi:TolB-like protein/Flp pilus assembly protein TadD|nr:winged helix-turn-helix domain-containing protein [Rhodopila sp.]
MQDYRFGGSLLDLRRGVLVVNGAERPLRPKSFALLQHLAERAGQLVGRDEIMEAVWPGTFVTEDSITQCIRDIRRALGDEDAHFLRTLPRRGYMLAIANAPAAEHQPEPMSDSGKLPSLPAGRPMVIVLPFENIGGDLEHRYFADGLRADLVTDLTHFQELHVVAPATADHLANGVAGSASYMVGGSVRRAGGRIRINVQLRDAASGVSVWAERFDRPLEDLFALQEDLTNHVAASVETRIGREGLRRLQRHPPANLDAYDLYLQGRELHGRSTEKDMLLARQYFDRAIAADPLYAPAHAWQAYAVQRGFTLGWGMPKGRAALDLALSFARRAVALEPDSSACLARLALVLALAGQHAEAVGAAERGARANPSDAAGRAAYGEVLSMSGNHAAGVTELRTALSLNPFHPPFWRATLGRALLLAGRHQEALEELERSRSEAPDYRPCHSSLLVTYVETGQMEAAFQAAKDFLRLRPGFTLHDYDGVFGFSRASDTDRFLTAFRTAGLR